MLRPHRLCRLHTNGCLGNHPPDLPAPCCPLNNEFNSLFCLLPKHISYITYIYAYGSTTHTSTFKSYRYRITLRLCRNVCIIYLFIKCIVIDDTFSACAGSRLYGFRGETGSGEEFHSTAETCVVIDPGPIGFPELLGRRHPEKREDGFLALRFILSCNHHNHRS